MQSAPKGFDVSAVINGSNLSAWVPFGESSRVKIRYIPRDKLREISAKSMTVNFDPKTRQKREEVDPLKWDTLLGKEAIEDWDGFVTGDNVCPCTPENIELFMSRWSEFAKFIGDVCVDLENLQAADLEAARKNSGNSSAQGPTIQP